MSFYTLSRSPKEKKRYLDVRNAKPALGADGEPVKTRFDELFGSFAVGGMSPEQRVGASEYFVLRLDFSQDDSDWEGMVRLAAMLFARKYPKLGLHIEPGARPSTILGEIELAVSIYQLEQGLGESTGKLAVLIDEYDSPCNKLMDPEVDDPSVK